MRTVNRERKQKGLPGVSNLKHFRQLDEFDKIKDLCKSVIKDVKHFAIIKEIADYNLDAILDRLNIADINDCIYLDYCLENNIKIYTFDSDLRKIGKSKNLYIFLSDSNKWVQESS